MQRKSILAILGVMLAVVVTSLALVFTVGPMVSGITEHGKILVLKDWEDFEIDENYRLNGLSEDVKTFLGLYTHTEGSNTYYFNDNSKFTEVHLIIPEGVKIIKNCCFNYSLAAIVTLLVLPRSLEKIEWHGLSDFWNVDSIIIPSNVTIIENEAFGWCQFRKIYCEVNAKPDGWANNWGMVNDSENVIWDCNKTVLFETNGGTPIDIQNVLRMNCIQSPTTTKAHHQFVGWYSDEQLTQPFDFNTPINNNLTLYAKWEIDKCTVNFLNYKGDHVPNQQIDYGSCAVEPTPTCEGYTFLGWYNLANDQKFDFNTPITYDMQLYAKWRDNSKPEEDPTQPENNETPSTTVENKNNGVIGWVIGLVLAGVGAAGTVAGVVVAKKRRK